MKKKSILVLFVLLLLTACSPYHTVDFNVTMNDDQSGVVTLTGSISKSSADSVSFKDIQKAVKDAVNSIDKYDVSNFSTEVVDDESKLLMIYKEEFDSIDSLNKLLNELNAGDEEIFIEFVDHPNPLVNETTIKGFGIETSGFFDDIYDVIAKKGYFDEEFDGDLRSYSSTTQTLILGDGEERSFYEDIQFIDTYIISDIDQTFALNDDRTLDYTLVYTFSDGFESFDFDKYKAYIKDQFSEYDIDYKLEKEDNGFKIIIENYTNEYEQVLLESTGFTASFSFGMTDPKNREYEFTDTADFSSAEKDTNFSGVYIYGSSTDAGFLYSSNPTINTYVDLGNYELRSIYGEKFLDEGTPVDSSLIPNEDNVMSMVSEDGYVSSLYFEVELVNKTAMIIKWVSIGLGSVLAVLAVVFGAKKYGPTLKEKLEENKAKLEENKAKRLEEANAVVSTDEEGNAHLEGEATPEIVAADKLSLMGFVDSLKHELTNPKSYIYGGILLGSFIVIAIVLQAMLAKGITELASDVIGFNLGGMLDISDKTFLITLVLLLGGGITSKQTVFESGGSATLMSLTFVVLIGIVLAHLLSYFVYRKINHDKEKYLEHTLLGTLGFVALLFVISLISFKDSLGMTKTSLSTLNIFTRVLPFHLFMLFITNMLFNKEDAPKLPAYTAIKFGLSKFASMYTTVFVVFMVALLFTNEAYAIPFVPNMLGLLIPIILGNSFTVGTGEYAEKMSLFSEEVGRAYVPILVVLVLAILFILTIKHFYDNNECKDKMKFSALVAGAYVLPMMFISYISSIVVITPDLGFFSDGGKMVARNSYVGFIVLFVLLAGLVYVRLEYLYDLEILNTIETKVLYLKEALANIGKNLKSKQED